jgi:hypothetical protein
VIGVGVLKQGVKFLSTELRCGGPPVSIVQSDEVNLTCNIVRKPRGIPVVVELCFEGVLKFTGVKG